MHIPFNKACQLARSHATHPTTLLELSLHPSSKVRSLLPGNPNTPFNALLNLSTDTSVDVRMEIARSDYAPEEALQILAEDTELNVRAVAALHPACSLETLLLLSNDADHRVRSMALENTNLPLSRILELACSDPLLTIRLKALSFANDDYISQEEILELVEQGPILTMKIDMHDNYKTLGDYLLQQGQSSLYQKLLSAELLSGIKSIKEDHPPKKLHPSNHRML